MDSTTGRGGERRGRRRDGGEGDAARRALADAAAAMRSDRPDLGVLDVSPADVADEDRWLLVRADELPADLVDRLATSSAWVPNPHEAVVVEAIARVLDVGTAPLAYLPIVRLTDQAVVGAESLLRVTDGAGRRIAPGEVIGVAERSGTIGALGRLVLRAACTEGARWAATVPESDCQVSVNLSVQQLLDPDLPDVVAEELAAARLAPARLVIEITEAALSRDLDAAAHALAGLKATGVRLVLDDFGTGHASLAHLSGAPLDGVKLDVDFVARLAEADGAAIVRAMVGMASALGLTTIAEGIEDLDQLAVLRHLGCRFGQGHLWTRAVPGEAVPSLLGGATSLARGTPPPPADHPRTRASDVADAGDDAVFDALVHEIRTPLTVVSGFAALLEHTTDDDSEQAEAVRRIVRASHRIEHLLRNLEDVAKVDSGALRLVTAEVDVAQLVARVVDDLQPTLGVPVDVVPPDPAPPTVRLDEIRVEQSLINLISNAAKYSPVSGRITTTVEHRGDWVEIAVTDEGPGVPEDQLGLIFRKYGRGDRSGPGSGLGLYLARGVARAHGGDVRYRRASVSGGATFVVRLPLRGARDRTTPTVRRSGPGAP